MAARIESVTTRLRDHLILSLILRSTCASGVFRSKRGGCVIKSYFQGCKAVLRVVLYLKNANFSSLQNDRGVAPYPLNTPLGRVLPINVLICSCLFPCFFLLRSYLVIFSDCGNGIFRIEFTIFANFNWKEIHASISSAWRLSCSFFKVSVKEIFIRTNILLVTFCNKIVVRRSVNRRRLNGYF